MMPKVHHSKFGGICAVLIPKPFQEVAYLPGKTKAPALGHFLILYCFHLLKSNSSFLTLTSDLCTEWTLPSQPPCPPDMLALLLL